MDKKDKLFIIGLIIGLIIPGAEKIETSFEMLETPLGMIALVYVSAATIWNLIFLLMLLVSLLAIVFRQIESHLSKTQFLPFPFMTGSSFGFTFIGILNILFF